MGIIEELSTPNMLPNLLGFFISFSSGKTCTHGTRLKSYADRISINFFFLKTLRLSLVATVAITITHHTNGFHGEKYGAEEQRYAFDGADRFATFKRWCFAENVVKYQRETDHGHASGYGGERRQEF
jgi:hypothetical protein